MKCCLERFGYLVSKPAIERRAVLKKIDKKYGIKQLLKDLKNKIEGTSKARIEEIRILKNDLKWIEKELRKP
jgi:hypothetical protein